MGSEHHVQEPVAIIGMACRLPGENNSPRALWEFLERGGIASNDVPANRFNLKGHYDGSRKPGTMRPPGGMFLESVDLADFDAPFFEISRAEAVSMDPNQRQMLEVVYESLENAGITLGSLDGASVGCFVGSYAVDYHDIQSRDPEDRPASIEVGIGRAILSNRISHFFNIKGPSITIDTACSGSLVGVDVACRYLQSKEISSAIVAASNLYISPEHVMDTGPIRMAHSPTGRCHTFDVKADGYIKSEAVNAVILKRLSDAIRDGNPIRSVIRGSATNSDGRTPGIASPNPVAQAAAVRSAYQNAGISDFGATGYLECHGTGTQAGDPLEVQGIASVFSESRSPEDPLIIGSIKSNLGHSEPASGLNGLLKAVLAIENGLIPGNPTFETPNPEIDFHSLKVRATRSAISWPDRPFRRASINSFGYGGTNSHVILDHVMSFDGMHEVPHISSFLSEEADMFADEASGRPYVLVVSANDETSLHSYCTALDKHLSRLDVKVRMPDLAYTLSERRTHHFHRAYAVVSDPEADEISFHFGKKSKESPKIGYVFTGQGAQWPEMGKALIENFAAAKPLLKELDHSLQQLPDPPSWSLIDELVEPRTPEHLRLPEFSQPLVTALQLVILTLFESWGIIPISVAGHSSGEIAAAYASGYLTKTEAIKVAFYRGQSAKNCKHRQDPVGMLAVGLGPENVLPYMQNLGDSIQIACFNSRSSVTLSGTTVALETLKLRLMEDNHFARMLQVDLAYHSRFMTEIGADYESLLSKNFRSLENKTGFTRMFSSVTGLEMEGTANALYWKSNMVSPVRFEEAVRGMVSGRDSADFLIEIGPSGALAGPISQIKEDMGPQGSRITYCKALSRGADAIESTYDVAGRIFVAGGSIFLAKVNESEGDSSRPSVIVDLPNYVWNHSTKYWHENQASKDWRYRQYSHHDLLGTKVLGSPWHTPSFRKTLRLENLPWLRDHRMGSDILFPASGYIAMAIEALYQTSQVVNPVEGITSADQLRYKLRNVKFDKALVLEDSIDAKLTLSLTPHPGTKNTWYDFKISSSIDEGWITHCVGLIRLEEDDAAAASREEISPLQHPCPGHLWYKAQADVGYRFGPMFQKQQEVEALAGKRKARSRVSLEEPPAAHSPQTPYPIHPVCIDGCFQTVVPSLWAGERSAINAVLIPASIDSLVINSVVSRPPLAISVTSSEYTGRGRSEEAKNYLSYCSVYDPQTGVMILKLEGLRYHELDTGIEMHAAHTYTRITWKPDITFLSQDQLLSFPSDGGASKIQDVIDLIAHKNPSLKVIEVNVSIVDTSCFWFERATPARAAYSSFHFSSSDAKTLISVQSDYGMRTATSFKLQNLTQTDFSPAEADYDLAIIKVPTVSDDKMSEIARNARGLLAKSGFALFVEQGLDSLGRKSRDSSQDSSLVIVDGNDDPPGPHIIPIPLRTHFTNPLEVPTGSDRTAWLSSMTDSKEGECDSAKWINVCHIADRNQLSRGLKSVLEQHGWQVVEHFLPYDHIQPKSTILILDELSSPLLTKVNESQWLAIKKLITDGHTILWATNGSQMEVSKPDNALIHGFSRTIRAEDRGANLTTLDLENPESPSSYGAVERALRAMSKPAFKMGIDSEYVERGGVIYVHRIVPNEAINQAKQSERHGADPVKKSLHDINAVTMLRAERMGTLDALCYSEMSTGELPLEKENVEVEIYAAGLNFKDIAVTMGIVPENEYLLGLEGAGIVRRVGDSDDDQQYKVGDRVAVMKNGTFANRIQVPVQRVHRIPDSLSFEDAATIPVVYLTSIYSLFNLGGLRKGQSVLIHSAAGGIGLACIQLAQWIGAEIFVTVGTEEKRNLLHDTFGIPSERMFSSRNTKFASSILEATAGKGIDVIINSLTGELLDESWRICADGGTMVEIGKKDIVERNYLSMEPFDRNCSFRAVDFSYKQITHELIASLLSQTFKLIAEGHIKAIHPITSFSFGDIPAAFAYMRSGRHIGKIVITDGDNASLTVPMRPPVRKLSLRGDVSYLIVGGLKGLCGSLAVYLAKIGAKNIIAMSRSGCSDPRSQKVIEDCKSLGCAVQGAKADVSNASDVRHVFQHAKPRIGGIIQGAMVLRDKPYETMTLSDFHTTISSKVQGTWNLHNASLQQKTPLDFFTLLSSLSGIIGQKGQANYAAGSAFLDAFALYRHSLGLAAHSVDLGVIEDVGYIAERDGMQSRLDIKQWTGINEQVLHKILSYSIFQQTDTINRDSAAQMITGIPVPQPPDSDLSLDARFSALFISDDGSTRGKAGSGAEKEIQAFLLLHTSGADHAALLSSAVEIVSAQLTKILRLGDPIEPAKSLSSYGLDSLSAVEFRNWVRADLGAAITVFDITNASSLFVLCEKIVSKLPSVSSG